MNAIALSTIVSSLFIGSFASANPIAIPQEIHAKLVHEEVDIKIGQDKAQVSGVYKFKNQESDFVSMRIFLPVYAQEGTPVGEMKPVFKGADDKVIDAAFVKKEWENDALIRGFGELPQLEGQRVYWFMIPYVPQQPGQTEFTLKISYTQKLSSDRFIYTPLIPNQKKDHDYGSITVSADRPLCLIDSDNHDFVKVDGKFVVEPSHKRAIVVGLAKVKTKLP